MKRINARTVEYTDHEWAIKEGYEQALDDGLGIQDAAWKVLNALPPQERVDLSMAFVLYLSDGTVGYTVLTGQFYKRYPTTMPVRPVQSGGAA